MKGPPIAGSAALPFGSSSRTAASPIYSPTSPGRRSKVFALTETTSNSSVHLGTNTVNFGGGLTFDEYSLSATILNATGGSTGSALLPWPGEAPEVSSLDLISFGTITAVPEPATWGLTIIGFGAMAAALRRRRTVATVRFA